MATSTGMFVSCKDYDDDIKDLQEQIDRKASIEELKSQLSTIESSLAEAKTALATTKSDAEKALAAAQEAEKKAIAAGNSADAAQAAAEKAAAEVELKAAEAKKAAIAAAEEKVNALKTEIENSVSTSLEEIKAIAAKVDAVAAEAMKIVGHRLSTLAVIPTTHVNGIAAIELTTLKYDPQVYQALTGPHIGGPTDTNHPNRPVLDHKSNGAPTVYVSTEKNEAYFHVSPSMGVRKQDIQLPSFDCILSENTARGVNVTTNTPVKPTDYSIDKNVLTVYFKKTVTGALNPTTGAHGQTEKFHMASLKAPITEENWTAAEKEVGDPVYVNSEYVRLEELIKVPYLVNTRTDFTKNDDIFADETQTDAKGEFYVHYHDSLCVYDSKVNELVDVIAQYDQPLDLKKLVTVCAVEENDEKNHATHEDWTSKYKNYGLAFRFSLATAAYNTLGGPEGNSNKTDQQKFAKIDTPANGIMTSKVYTINGGSATAVGREPIVRVELRDTVNNNLVAQRYIKVKWAKTIEDIPLTSIYADSIYVCGNYYGVIGTQKMNEDIYDKVKEGGMTKHEFHNIYKDNGFDGTTGKGEGEVKLVMNTENDVESYNLAWTLTHKDIVTKYPDWNAQEKMEFTKVCTWKDETKANATLVITLKRTIYKPVFHLWGYDNRYWRTETNNTVFNVNPVVYQATDWNPGWGETVDHKNAPTCNIYTDLLNGFVDDKGYKPATGADGAVWFEDKGNATWAGKKLYYSAAYPTVKSGTNLGEARTTNNYVAYSTEGVRFVFDAKKLSEDAKYVYNYYDEATAKYVEKRATVSADGTQLFIDGQLAATIHNYRDNLCTNSLNSTLGDKTYHIVLEEENWNHAVNPYPGRVGSQPTEAARALVGEYVPVKMMADLCYDDGTKGIMEVAHTETLKAYDAFIIEPLTPKKATFTDFTDATVGGSRVEVKEANKYQCWNADKDHNYYIAANTEGLEKELFEFYECKDVKWRTDLVTTNLELVNGNLQPSAKADYKEGRLPSSTTVEYDSATEELVYNNHSGTPVNWDYIIYIPVEYGYKWKTISELVAIKVVKNAGTPASN
ncbi:MAG: hypothetical protein K2G02_07995 [Phocaeicola sp.]|nr:hypothetical protein [Phocaeicola sp.]